MKVIKFRSELADMILQGKKTTTFRLFDDKDLRAGDEIHLVRWETGEEFGKTTIREAYEKTLGELTEDDFVGHERYVSEEEMYTTLRTFYGDSVGPHTVVKIIRFTV
ncbi:MAG: hypothetical protein UY72_C0026G0004 [Candidatus Uhrbacteria bacterium GW2011_GWD2_52_7]|uniref:ASCH domain-containing protein n=1 Tax=Candidatus Uhrbacteria bacterium GW2011_GWD2_52_7 TaxID=1618989 RepID=A0A0G1ZPD7_9BACT|nr:MAG: hypothetical protein UY72_C0026G0004 [Candidatus Uhrbacteria bacterium GW2011_GWD2_52_7]